MQPPERSRETPAVGQIVHRLIDHFPGRVTLLAVCPNSEAVARAALKVAHEADMPLLLAATLNQVDRDGGYTGWTPGTFVRFVEEQTARMPSSIPVFVCLDHGGPWLKDRHTTEALSFDETMAAVKASLEACIDAGYALLHIDPTVDRQRLDGTPLPVEVVVERTLHLIEHAERHRKETGAAPIAYEVGTEEVHGGLADVRTFRTFLELLAGGLKERDLEHAWPAFIVGKVGTDLGTTRFDPAVSRELARILAPYRATLKGHYTDFVADPAAYPLSGMGGANVGPEFTDAEYRALEDLVRLETRIGKSSCLLDALREAVVASGRWQKWLRADERDRPFSSLPKSRQRWLLRTCSRYVWAHLDVAAARAQLYRNVQANRNPQAYISWRIESVMWKYVHAFNLVGFNARLAQAEREGFAAGRS